MNNTSMSSSSVSMAPSSQSHVYDVIPVRPAVNSQTRSPSPAMALFASEQEIIASESMLFEPRFYRCSFTMGIESELSSHFYSRLGKSSQSNLYDVIPSASANSNSLSAHSLAPSRLSPPLLPSPSPSPSSSLSPSPSSSPTPVTSPSPLSMLGQGIAPNTAR